MRSEKQWPSPNYTRQASYHAILTATVWLYRDLRVLWVHICVYICVHMFVCMYVCMSVLQ